MVSGKLLFFLVATCLAAPPKLTFPSFSSPVGELTEEDRVQEKVASLTGITKDDEEQKASLKESFLDKHEKFLGLLDFDFFSSAAKTSEFEEKVEIPQSGSGRQAQLANPMPGSSGSHMNDETSEGTEFGSPISRVKYIIRHFRHGLNEFCTPNDLNTLIGEDISATTKETTTLPGSRCFTDDLFHPGRCIEPSCQEIKYCGTRGHQIVGRCKSRTGAVQFRRLGHDRLCCMPPK